jgi:hypothetical protein
MIDAEWKNSLNMHLQLLFPGHCELGMTNRYYSALYGQIEHQEINGENP